LEDWFGPASTPIENYVRLPEKVKVKFISKEEELQEMDILLKEKWIGVDSEWKPQLTKADESKPVLF